MIMNPFIPVNEPLLDGNEKKYVNEAIDSGWISSEGPFVQKFEEEFAKRIGRKFGVSVSNGTAALEIAVKALGIGKGDEVILPSFTIISCAGAIVKAGGTPVLVDSDKATWNMDVSAIENKINNRTKAIMAVHIYGLPIDMDHLLELCTKYNLYLIEDAAQMHGQTYKNRPCGSFGDVSTFSFYPNKHITTGEGGMIVTNNEKFAEDCKYYRNLCFESERRFYHNEIGWNYRFTNIQAAIGLAQLETLDSHILKKKEIGLTYTKYLSGIEELQLPVEKTDYAENIYWVFGLVYQGNKSADAFKLMAMLKNKGIGTRPFFWPMNKQPVLIRMGLFGNENYPVAENLGVNGFYVPSGLGLDIKRIPVIAECIKECLHEVS